MFCDFPIVPSPAGFTIRRLGLVVLNSSLFDVGMPAMSRTSLAVSMSRSLRVLCTTVSRWW